ncbi:substrate-binding periplasmic protein [Inhella sp.]|uniref:substrate-binding periplasmic protein n=1 Tax=Inhella sp. TaxID=1921806 RepID=UPI0035ADDC33
MHRRFALLLPLLLAGLAGLGVAQAAGPQAPPRELHYFDIPPMSFADAKGQPAGTMVERLRQIWPAGLEMPPLRLAPLKRSLHDILERREPVCLLGVFMTPERAAQAWFSNPIFRESPSVFIATRALAQRLKQYPSAQALVTDRSQRLLLTDGASYGPLDEWIQQRGPAVLRVAAPPPRQLHMLLRGHAEFMFSDEHQAVQMLKELGPEGHALEWFVLPGMVAPPTRHLMCQRDLDPQWLRALDAGLSQLDLSAPAGP